MAGLEHEVHFVHRLFLLEDADRMPLGTTMIEGVEPVAGQLVPDLESKPWQRDPSEFPVSSLLANEAVRAAEAQSPRAAEELDIALRMGFWCDSRCITMLHEVLDVAAGCPAVDHDALMRRGRDPRRCRQRWTSSKNVLSSPLVLCAW